MNADNAASDSPRIGSPRPSRGWPQLGDRIAALLLLTLLSPAILLTALAVWLEPPHGPVFYRQERVGLNRRRSRVPRRTIERRRTPGDGMPFRMWKFRTMVPDAEARTGPVWAAAHDSRITRIGAVLRKLRIDEIPQLINVLAGDMRLIGPRPERPYFIGRLAERLPDYRKRLSVPPGITGLAQVERSYDGSIDDVKTKLRYDLFYIKNRCTALDLKILLKTVDVVLNRRGAH